MIRSPRIKSIAVPIEDILDTTEDIIRVQIRGQVYPLRRDLIDRGIPAPGHSDANICDANPWLAIYSMVTRKTSSGDVLYSEEGIEPLEAIRAYTIDGAYAAWEENIKGTIEPGKLADLVVIDKDPTKINPNDLKKIKNLMTVTNGKIVLAGHSLDVMPTFTIEDIKAKVKVDGERIEGPFYRFIGDLADNGKGKLFVSVEKNSYLKSYNKYLA